MSAKNNAISNAVNSPDYNNIYTSSSAWWSDFWKKSYVFFPSQLNFEQRRNYYMYLAAISNRGNYPSKYNGGIWIAEEDRRDWGSYFWNWNQDSLYHPLMAANHVDLMEPMFKMRETSYAQYQSAASQMWGASGVFISETAGVLGWETLPTAIADSMRAYYNFTTSTRSQAFTDMTKRRNTFLTPWNWNVFGSGNNQASYVTHTMMATQETAEYYWQRYCYTKDLTFLRERAYPFIKGAAEFYRTYPGFRKDSDGKYHFYNTNLHEHIWGGKDVIDDLSMARGVFAAVIKAAQLLGVDSNMIATWTDCRDNLAPYPLRTDSGALWAGSTDSSMITKLATSSPAFAQGKSPDYFIRDLQGTESPIFKMVEKYDVLNLETKDQGLDGGNWAIAYNTYLHSPGYLNQVQGTVIDRNGSSRFHEDAAKFGAVNDMAHILNTQYGVFTTYGVYPNLLFDQLDYYSAEGYGTYAAALQDALNQSLAPVTGGDAVIRVFPAWPTTWDAKYKLLAKDGFLVSSSMVSGDIQYVEIESQLGGSCRIRNPWNTNVVLYRNGVQAETITSSKNALITFNTITGEDIVLVRPGTTPDQYRTSSLGGNPTPTPTPTPTLTPTPTPVSGKYEAENATLTSGAVVATDHTGYSGTGFVAGYVTQGATTTFNVSVSSAGNYNVDMRYSAGNGARNVSVYVNGVDVKQTSLPATTNWDTWGNKTETLTLNAGSNTITYKYDSSDTGWINIDYITVTSSSSYNFIKNVATGLYIDGMGSTTNGSNACQYSSSGSNNQQWKIIPSGSNVLIQNRATGLYLDGMGLTANGSVCAQYSSSGSTNQQWVKEASGSNFRFKNVATGLYLDGMGSTSNGSNLCQWGNSGSTNQQWQIQ